LFVLVLTVPWLGAAFTLVLPASDRLTLRAVGVVTGVLAFVAGAALSAAGGATTSLPGTTLVVSWSGMAAPAALTVLAVSPLALRAGAPRIAVALPAYVVAMLATTALSVLAIVLVDVRAAIAAATVAAVPPFALVALFGGPERGSASYRAAGLWLLLDAAALAALALSRAWQGPLLVVLSLGPGLVRLAAGPWGLWALPVFEQAPVSAACVMAGAVAPVGAVLLGRLVTVAGVVVDPVVVDPVVVPVIGVLAAAALTGAALVVVERDLRRLVAHVLGLLGALVAASVLVGEGGLAVTLVVLMAFSASLALMVVEAIERRLETRRVPELAGLWSGAPVLGALLPASLWALAGLPWPGTGAAVWPAVAALAGHRDPVLGLSGLVFGAAILVVAVGVVVVAGRACLPPRRRQPQIGVSFLQGIRLLVPFLALLVASIMVQRLVAATVPSMSSASAPSSSSPPSSPVAAPERP
jgi:NADH:ubiquinone oxidoreductase subunit 4 (subunit M)